MKFLYKLNEYLPPLSWAMIHERGNDTITVIHGSAVYTTNNLFIAGVWEGVFEEYQFESAYAMQGSAVKLIKNNNQLLVCTSSNMQDAIYSCNRDNMLYVSNSMNFILALTDGSLDPECYDYEVILNSSFFGEKRYIKSLPVINGQINIWRRSHIYIDDNQNITRPGGVSSKSKVFYIRRI